MLTLASEEKPKNDDKTKKLDKLEELIPKAETSKIKEEKPKTSLEDVKKAIKQDMAKRQGRYLTQLTPYDTQNDNEVVVDIQDGEKKQYYETNYDTSK